jgi:hypothetical protein
VHQRTETHLYEVRPRKDHRGVHLISDALPFGRLWSAGANAISNAIGYAEHFSRSHDAVIRVYDAAGNVIEMHEHNGDFKEWRSANRRVVVSLVDNATFRKCSKIGRQKMELKLPGK